MLGCAGTHSSRSSNVDHLGAAVDSMKNNATILASPSPAAMPEYRIGILDELEIRVRYHDRLNGVVKVRPDGRITLEDIGDVYVANMTPTELDTIITKAYSDLIHAPEVTVIVRSFASLSVYVLGEVRNPGAIELKPKMTVLQALAATSGPIRGAKMNSVMMLRRDTTGVLKAVRLDLKASAVKKAEYQDLFVQPEDIIFVPKTFIASVDEFLTQVYAGVLPPLDIYFRALRIYVRANP
jgi:polysaccharide biosynthesis/export protein PslD